MGDMLARFGNVDSEFTNRRRSRPARHHRPPAGDREDVEPPGNRETSRVEHRSAAMSRRYGYRANARAKELTERNPMTLTTKATALTIKSAEGSTGMIEGYASTFNNIDTYGDTIKPGAFTETLAKHSEDDTAVPLLFEHARDLDAHVGQIIDAQEDDTGLLIRAQFDMDTDAGQKAFNLAKGRRIRGMSIGFVPLDVALEVLDGEDVFAIKKLDLKEISLVLNPADAQAQVTSVKSADVPPVATKETPVATKSEVTTWSKSIKETGDTSKVSRSIDDRLQELKTRRQAADYLDALTDENITTRGRYKQPGAHLTAEQREELAAKAIEQILDAADDDQGLSEHDAQRIEKINAANDATTTWIQRIAENSKLRTLFKNLDHDNDHDKKADATMGTNTITLTTKARRAIAQRAADDIAEYNNARMSARSGGGAISTSLIVDPDIQALESPAKTLLELLPAHKSDPAFAYIKQTTRVNNADVVPTGGRKPTSEYGFESLDGKLEVVAHIAKELDNYMLQDVGSLSGFIQAEMVAGVFDRVEGLVVEALDDAEGATEQPFNDDVFGTTRAAVTKLQSVGLNPGAFLLNPLDWELLELSRASGSGHFVFGSTPVNQIERTLWSVPVTVSNRVTAGAPYLIDLESVKLRTDGSMQIAWDSSGEAFDHNQFSIRAESRFHAAVTRETGVVKMDTTGETGE